jgi:hypothetical protein
VSYTKGDYEAVEAIIRNNLVAGTSTSWREAVLAIRDSLCAMFIRNNPQFDPNRFMAACEPPDTRPWVIKYNDGKGSHIVECFERAEDAQDRVVALVALIGSVSLSRRA